MDCSFMDIGENRNKAPSLSRNLNSFCYIFFLSEIQITKTMNEIEKLEDEYIKAQSLKTWQEQFDNEFRAYWTEAPEPIKDFISNLLQERDKELVEKIEGLKYTEDMGIDAEMESANGAWEQVIQIIKSRE